MYASLKALKEGVLSAIIILLAPLVLLLLVVEDLFDRIRGWK